MSELTRYLVDPHGVALLQLDRPQSRNAINTPMLEELLWHLATARNDENVRVLVISSTDHMGLSRRAPTSRRTSTRPAPSARWSCSRASTTRSSLSRGRRSPPATAPASAVAPRSPSPATCASAARTCACASRAPRSACPVGPARLVTLCGLSVAKYCLLTSKEIDAEMALRWGLVHKVAPAAATEEAALTLAAHMATMPPSRCRRSSSCCTSGTTSSAARRSKARARSSGSPRDPASGTATEPARGRR